MPDAPDFEQIANAIEAEHRNATDITGIGTELRGKAIAEQLRLIWNARGAADLAAATRVSNTRYTEAPTGRDWIEDIEDALRGLDR